MEEKIESKIEKLSKNEDNDRLRHGRINAVLHEANMRVKVSEDDFEMRLIKHDKDMRQIDKDMKEMTEEIERIKGKIVSKREVHAQLEKRIFKDIRE